MVNLLLDLTVLVNVWPKDSAPLFEDALASILLQSKLPNEVMVISDGKLTQSQRTALKRFSECADFPVVIHEKFESTGLWDARNIGLSLAKNKYVALMDADDVMHPNRLELQAKFIAENPVHLLGAAIVEIDSDSKKVIGIRRPPLNQKQIESEIKFRNVINHPTVVLDREFALRIGGYKNFFLAEDYELWARMVSSGAKVANLPQVLLGFHTTEALFKRRGGLRFIIPELKLALTLNSYFKDVNIIRYLSNFFVRVTYRLLPWKLRKRAHLGLLLHEKDTEWPTETEFLASIQNKS